jgi:hypothetical protein
VFCYPNIKGSKVGKENKSKKVKKGKGCHSRTTYPCAGTQVLRKVIKITAITGTKSWFGLLIL